MSPKETAELVALRLMLNQTLALVCAQQKDPQATSTRLRMETLKALEESMRLSGTGVTAEFIAAVSRSARSIIETTFDALNEPPH